ncbi:MAG: hypothetical protein SWX82_24645 [Cyanobacteriota bacterium]|nr:hypothetical protein [Cyanobacteriota bacterium]
MANYIEISNNKKSNQLSHRNYQSFPPTGPTQLIWCGAIIGAVSFHYSLLPIPYFPRDI